MQLPLQGCPLVPEKGGQHVADEEVSGSGGTRTRSLTRRQRPSVVLQMSQGKLVGSGMRFPQPTRAPRVAGLKDALAARGKAAELLLLFLPLFPLAFGPLDQVEQGTRAAAGSGGQRCLAGLLPEQAERQRK